MASKRDKASENPYQSPKNAGKVADVPIESSWILHELTLVALVLVSGITRTIQEEEHRFETAILSARSS